MELVKADREILEYLKEHRRASPKELAYALKRDGQYIRNRLSLLAKAGLVKKVDYGLYEYLGGGEAKD